MNNRELAIKLIKQCNLTYVSLDDGVIDITFDESQIDEELILDADECGEFEDLKNQKFAILDDMYIGRDKLEGHIIENITKEAGFTRYDRKAMITALREERNPNFGKCRAPFATFRIMSGAFRVFNYGNGYIVYHQFDYKDREFAEYQEIYI